MFSHKNCDAFLAVVETGSFEAAALRLHISASAVSLRVQALEKYLGQILILRERPCRATQAGQLLLEHLQQARLQQQNLLQQLHGADQAHQFYKVTIATNADSLATWLLNAITPSLIDAHIALELKIADQSRTYHLLETGQVNACISTQALAMKGCEAQLLGRMRYRLVANPAFQQQYFAQGLHRQQLLTAPAVIFNAEDHLHQDFIQSHFGLNMLQYPHHFIPSSTAFLDCIKGGLGYGLVPEIQMQNALKQGRLLDLAHDLYVDVLLYWHHWKKQSPALEQLTQSLIQRAQHELAAV